MFTGIIESLGTIIDVNTLGTNKIFWIESPISTELKPDQSLSHNGVCLTVEEIKKGTHRVTAIEETLRKTNLGDWKPGDQVNLERCLVMNGRLDGHIVQGHVDTTATCLERKGLQGSHEFRFEFPHRFGHLVIEKGSISLNGISLTIFNVTGNQFTVAIIPYTITHTNLGQLKEGGLVNIEFDIVGKYIDRKTQLNNNLTHPID
jgi:riboflavin synthase